MNFKTKHHSKKVLVVLFSLTLFLSTLQGSGRAKREKNSKKTTLELYSAPKQVEASGDFSATVNGKEAFVFYTTNSTLQNRYMPGADIGSGAMQKIKSMRHSWVSFATKGKVKIAVKPLREFETIEGSNLPFNRHTGDHNLDKYGLFEPSKVYDLTGYADSVTVQRNPHKGLYHHYYDNGTDKYLGTFEEINGVPGITNLYVRLDWSHFEPEDNVYDWHWIDDLVEQYVPHGYTLGLTVCTKENTNLYATPKWVIDLGAKGEKVGSRSWEPDYNDPIYLSKLEEFYVVFAERYANKPWVEWVQVGSYGTWGEAHNFPASKKRWPNEVIFKHIELMQKYFPNKPMCLTDEAYRGAKTEEEKQEVKSFVEARPQLFWSDHSILHKVHLSNSKEDFGIKDPELFRDTWKNRQTQVEFAHYYNSKKWGWTVPEGGAMQDTLRGALEITHPTWIGFHGNAAEWYRENPKLSDDLANRAGYWYFLNSAEVPESMNYQTANSISLTWENKGYAPVYRDYKVILKLEGQGVIHKQYLTEARPKTWMPDKPVSESYSVTIPSGIPMGDYKVKIGLIEETVHDTVMIKLAINRDIMDSEGFYEIGSANVISNGVSIIPAPSGGLNSPDIEN